MTQWRDVAFCCMLGAHLLSRRTLPIPNYPLGCQRCSLELLHPSWELNFDWRRVFNTEGITFTKSWSPPQSRVKRRHSFLVTDPRAMHFRASNAKKRANKTLKPFVSPTSRLSWPSQWAYYNVRKFNHLFLSKTLLCSDLFWLQVCTLWAWLL